MDAQFSHDPRDQLLVDDEPLFDLEGSTYAETAIGASGAGVDVGDEIGEEQAADLAVVRLSELDVVVRRAVKADCGTTATFGVAQVVQPSDNLVLPFGSTAPSSNRALAALTISSSSSSSLMRRRAWARGSAS